MSQFLPSIDQYFKNKQLWYLATVRSFAVGWALGWEILDAIPGSKLTQMIFWAYPAGVAGLGMGFSQWFLIRRIYKYAFLWIPATFIGLIASTGATLTLYLAIPAYFEGKFDYLYGGMLVTFTPIAPIALLFGPFCQWILIRNVASSQSFMMILKIGIGWVFATALLFVMFYLFIILAPVIEDSIPFIHFLRFLFMTVVAIPSGLVFAHTTKTILPALLNEAPAYQTIK